MSGEPHLFEASGSQQRFNRIHALCTMLRQKPCDRCPAWIDIDDYGKGKQGCRLHAEEAVNIVKYGNPWGARHRRKGVKRWRAKFNRVYADE